MLLLFFYISYFTNDGSVKFSHFYDKLLIFVEDHKLNENATKSLLGMLLRGEPYDVYMDLRRKEVTLQTMIDTLASRYSDKKTINQYMNMLRNIRRKSNETLRTAMSRSECLIQATNAMVPESDRPSRTKFLQHECLIKLASSKARRAIENYLRNAQREGLITNHETLLNLACDIEGNEENHFESSTLLAAPATVGRTSDRASKLEALRKSRAPSPIRKPSWRESRSSSADSNNSPASATKSNTFSYDRRDVQALTQQPDRGRSVTRQQTNIRPAAFNGQQNYSQNQSNQHFQNPNNSQIFHKSNQNSQNSGQQIYKLPFAQPQVRGPPPPPPGGNQRFSTPNVQQNFQPQPHFNVNRRQPSPNFRNTSRERRNSFGNSQNRQANYGRNQSSPIPINNKFQNNGRNGNYKGKKGTHVLQTFQLSPNANQFYQKIGLNIPILCNKCHSMHFAFDNCQDNTSSNFKPNYKERSFSPRRPNGKQFNNFRPKYNQQ